jgi:CDP-6-deoxy-D-xylo-4-hexulose-3-dehydrase
MSKFYLPLMDDNIDKEDINSLISFLSQDQIPKLTNGPKVIEFENKWGEWLGTRYNIMVNSGASANELTMLALNYIHGEGEIIVPPLTWISDISSVIFSGFKPVFCDINLKNLSFDIDKLKQIITYDTKAIFLTHVLGINGLTDELLQICKDNNILLIEDVCESHGATFKGKKAGSIGFASNFSFYFAHHMSTIEGGMICTNDEYFYQICRALRSHGMVREMTDEKFKQQIIDENPDLNKDFIFLNPAHNFRSTEINAVLGLSQIKKLDNNNSKRINNFKYFIEHLDSSKYITDIEVEGQCNYAFIIILKEPSFEIRDKVESVLKENRIEFRRGLSGGGNQLRQPYFKENYSINYDDFKNTDHIHHFSWYVGNYPTLEKEKINTLINILNNI